jgi:hypothetical protein
VQTASEAFASGLPDRDGDSSARLGKRAGRRALSFHYPDVVAGEVHDEGDVAEHEASRLQRLDASVWVSSITLGTLGVGEPMASPTEVLNAT